MGPKKPAKNDFYFFMLEKKSDLERQHGRSYSMKEMADICGSLWPQVSREERMKYKEKAKKDKEGQKQNLGAKFDVTGRSLLDVENERKEQEQNILRINNAIRDSVQSAKLNGQLAKKKFYFVHFNILCETHEKVFVPCEIAVVEYSLEDGIANFVHSFVQPPDEMIPMGYLYTIQRNAEQSHALYRDSKELNSKAAGDWDFILTKLLNMIRPEQNEALPPLYTLEEDSEKTKSILSSMFARSKYPERRNQQSHPFDVFPVHRLLFELAQQAGDSSDKFMSVPLAKMEFERDSFKFSRGVSCPFHESVDKCHHCSFTHVKRWAFIISGFILPDLKLGYIPGRHCPEEEVFRNIKPSARIPPPLPDGFLCPWSESGASVGLTMAPAGELNLFNVRKTKSKPAGHVEPAGFNEELVVERGPSNLLDRAARWDDGESGRSTGAGRRNVWDSDKRSSTSWKDEVDAVPFQQQQQQQHPPNKEWFDLLKQQDQVLHGWNPSSGQTNIPTVSDDADFPPLGGGPSARGGGHGRGQGRGRGAGDNLSWGMSRMKL